MQLTITTIGSINLDCSGSDQYVLVERSDGDLSPKQAKDWVLSQYYRDTYREAGGYFCHYVNAVRKKHRPNACICVIEHRYDI